MAQIDVYENKNPKTKRLIPFLLDTQIAHRHCPHPAIK
jgi:hypothetical protein